MKDIEYLHRMRVASRKMLNLLLTFRNCFTKSQQKTWIKDIKLLASSLGKARDTDVQVLFLNDFDSRISIPELHPGIQRFNLRLQQKRQRQQSKVIKAIDKFHKSSLNKKGLSYIRKRVKGKRLLKQKLNSVEFADMVLTVVRRKISNVLAYDSLVLNQDNVEELHELRKLNKLLRYTLETFQPVFRSSLDGVIQKLNDLHEIVGSIHDCDVWIDEVQKFIEEEKRRNIKFYGSDKHFDELLPGLKHLLEERKSYRKVEYQKFKISWLTLKDTNFWGNLMKYLREFRSDLVQKQKIHLAQQIIL